MKYFKKSSYTADELKKEFHTLANNLHPDHGGNEEEFKAMMAEYSRLLASLDGGNKYTNSDTTADYMRRKWAEYQAKQAAEREEAERERRQREAEKRAEEARKAEELRRRQEVIMAAVRAWSGKLERIPEGLSGKRAYNFGDKTAYAKYIAITKRNVKKIIDFYFPGLSVKISISGRIYQEEFNISWQDGPTISTMEDTAKELNYFVPSYYESDPYCDYGNYRTYKTTEPWREAFGQALGDCTKVEFSRSLSAEGKEEAEEAAAAIFKNWANDTDHGRGTFTASLGEWCKFAEMLNAVKNSSCVFDFHGSGMDWANYAHNNRTENGGEVGEVYFSAVRRLLFERFTVTRQPKEKEPEFVPTFGKTYNAIKKVLNGGIFFVDNPAARSSREEIELNIFEAAERLANCEAVKVGRRSQSQIDGDTHIYGTTNGGGKIQTKRAAKFEAVGLTLEANGFGSIYATIKCVAINPDTLAALRAEYAEIERQRAKWEAKQAAQNDTKPDTTTTTDNTDTTTTDEAPADGLTLEEIPGGVAVTGDSRTTFKNRKAIKAHGATWNKEAQQWQAKDPDSVARLRAWFLLRNDEPQTETATPEPEPAQPTSEAEQLADCQLFDIFEANIASAVGYLGADLDRAPVEDWKFGYYYNNGKVNDLFKAFKLGRTL